MVGRSHYNAPVRVHSSAPTRIDLAGGTLDIWPLYLFHEDAQTVNAAITLRAECTVSPSSDGRLHVVAADTGAAIDAAHWSELDDRAELRLIARVLRFFRPSAVSIATRSGAPVGAGLAGSSAMNIALCGALSRWLDRPFHPESLIALALNLEAQVLGVPTGLQDYRPAMYGGIAAIEMDAAGVTRIPLNVDPRELGQRLILVYTGQSRDSGINNWEVTKRHLDGDPVVTALFAEIRDVAVGIRGALLASDWAEVGQHLDREWTLRKRLCPGVTTPRIDDLVARARAAGARAVKACGAGGGGCLLIFAEPDAVTSVTRELRAAGAEFLEHALDPDGLRVEVK